VALFPSSCFVLGFIIGLEIYLIRQLAVASSLVYVFVPHLLACDGLPRGLRRIWREEELEQAEQRRLGCQHVQLQVKLRKG